MTIGVALIAIPAGPAAGGEPAVAAQTAAAAPSVNGDGNDQAKAELGVPVPDLGQSEGKGAETLAAAPAAIDRNNKAAVAAAYQNYALNLRTVPMGWTGAVSNCNTGNVSAAAQKATFDTLNYLRQMAGLADISENTAASSVARKTALLMQANGQLSHYPPTTWKCFTNNGAFLAARSNIALGTGGDGILAGAKAIFAYVNDVGVDSLGHRRWILSPGQRTMGSGSTGNANALVWGNGSGSCSGSSCTVGSWNSSEDAPFTNTYSTAWSSPQFVAWPGAGYFPYQLTKSEFDSRQMDWSVSTGTSSISFANASVSVTKNGTAVSGITLIPRSTLSSGYGDQGAFAFRFPSAAVSVPAAGATDAYRVTISGITGVSGGKLQYDVKLFNPMEATVGAVTISGAPQVGKPLTAQVSGVSPAGSTLAYQWLRDGSTAVGSNSATYTPVSADYGHTIAVRVTPSKSGYTGVPLTSAAVGPVTAIAMTVAKPIISGPVQVNKTMTVGTVSTNPAGGSVKYEWVIGSTVVKTGTDTYARMLTPQAVHAGKTVYVKVTATRAGYQTAVSQSDVKTIAAADDPCAVAQAMITPRLWATNGKPTTGSAELQRSQIIRICANGEMRLYTLDTNTMKLGLTATIGSGWTGYRASAPGDWNRDGFNDIIGIDSSGRMWLYPRTASNGWAARIQIGSGWSIYERILAVGDLTKDGNPDLLAIDSYGDLFLYQGDGKNGWKNSGRRTQVGNGWKTFQLLPAGDLNGDGVADIMSIDQGGKLYWYPSRGSGYFGAQTHVGTGWSGLRAVSGASMNGDSVPDVVSVDGAGIVRFFPGRRPVAFGTAVTVAEGWR
ncbi:MAG: FG-GAP-like repeat-containing protein [Bifidobacteriaceae bacterium]|nr:FG-GAP-like repeat-containing protein [Bifidobacteriaceae bacterium]